MKIIFDNLTKKDAKLLRIWWDAHTEFYHFVRKMDTGKYFELIRQ